MNKLASAEWVSNTGPSGICGIVDVVTLEEPDDEMGKIGIGWKYKSSSFATQKEGRFAKIEKTEPWSLLDWPVSLAL